MTWTVETPPPLVVGAREAAAAAAAAGLVARTVALPDGAEGADVDLLAIGGSVDALLWQREVFALAGRGVALRLVLPSGLDDPTAVSSVLEALQA
ncbi:MAG: hypothetical protein QOJ52_264, partial [Acidimicrobiaceae bacterium]|nr:hypothetical protein [Acidimicrobiaceae bacterium]